MPLCQQEECLWFIDKYLPVLAHIVIEKCKALYPFMQQADCAVADQRSLRFQGRSADRISRGVLTSTRASLVAAYKG